MIVGCLVLVVLVRLFGKTKKNTRSAHTPGVLRAMSPQSLTPNVPPIVSIILWFAVPINPVIPFTVDPFEGSSDGSDDK